MLLRLRLPSLAGAVCLLTAIAVACGGDGGEPEVEGASDPESVATATPIADGEAVRYLFDGDVVSVSGGTAPTATTEGGTPPPGPGNQTYTIEAGDTCSGIAAEFGVTVEQIVALNQGVNEDCTNLNPGDVIRLPGPATPTPATGTPGGTTTPTPEATGTQEPSGGGTYTVQPGDTCADIAAAHGVSVDDLIAANGLSSDCTDLDVGQELTIP